MKRYLFLSLLLILLNVSTSNAAALIEWKCNEGERAEACAESGRVEFIYIYDEIDSETFSRIASFDGLLKANAKFPIVYLNSFGGSVKYSKAIGRILRRRGASVESKNVFFPKQKAVCHSGCVLIAAGAIDRQLSHIGLHRASTNNRVKGEVYQTGPSEAADEEVKDYYFEMGINPRINDLFLSVSHEDILDLKFNPNEPFEKQEIVKLGFRMHPETAISTDDTSTILTSGGGSSLAFAAERGDAEAALLLGELFFYGKDNQKKDTDKGLYWFKRAVDLGLARAAHSLGVIYSSGVEGIKRDYKQAYQFYKIAAEAGFAGAQNNLGWAYYKGYGVQKNNSAAIYWFTRSAEQGEPFAYSSLGEMYYRRIGFPRDDIETYKWLALAAEELPKGSAKSKVARYLDNLKARMSKVDIDAATKKVAAWWPLKQSAFVMRDKAD